MTTITIERALLEKALVALSAPNHCVFSEPQICVDLRAALAAPATAPEQPRPFIPWSKEAEMVASWTATAPDDRHAQELLAQDITIANMRERHAQELCAYQVTVDKLRAERKPMTDGEIEATARAVGANAYTNRFVDGSAFSFGPDALRKFVREVEAFHGSGEKP